MNTSQNVATNSNKSLRLLGWVLGLLFILKSLDFFLSISLSTKSELSLVIMETILFSISGVAMLLLALGTIRLSRWVRIPLYLVFISNLLFIIYNTLLVPNWIDAGISVIGAVVLFFYLKKSKNVATGRRLLGLQILTVLTLLPATLFLLLTVVFTDQALQDDSAMRLDVVATLNDKDNLYITLTNLGDELPPISETAGELVSEYPSSWNQATANQIAQQLQPHIAAYITGTSQEYQCPTSVNNFAMEAELCELNLMRDYAEIMQFAALYEARSGNVAPAQTYAMAPLKVGLTMIESDNVTLIEYLVGLASVNIGLDTLETLKNENVLIQTAIKQQLAGISILTDSLLTPMQREYLGYTIALEKHVDMSQSYFYHPNRTRNELFAFMSQIAETSVRGCPTNNYIYTPDTTVDTKLIEYVDNIQSNAVNPARPNRIGNIYLSVVLSTLNTISDNVCEANTRINSLKD
jgi:hypothetical protein